MTGSELPQVQAVLMQIDSANRRTDTYLWIVSICPFCGKRHSHSGGSNQTDPRTTLGRRAAPCKQGEYSLVDIAQQNPN